MKTYNEFSHLCNLFILAIKAEPLDDYQLHSCIYSDNQSLSGLSMKSLSHHLDQESNLQSLNVSPATYHLTSLDPRAHILIPDPLDDQPVYYRASTLTNNPALYHTANQRHSNCGTALQGSQMASHPTSAPSPRVSVRNLMGKLGEDRSSPRAPSSLCWPSPSTDTCASRFPPSEDLLRNGYTFILKSCKLRVRHNDGK